MIEATATYRAVGVCGTTTKERPPRVGIQIARVCSRPIPIRKRHARIESLQRALDLSQEIPVPRKEGRTPVDTVVEIPLVGGDVLVNDEVLSPKVVERVREPVQLVVAQLHEVFAVHCWLLGASINLH